MAALGRESFKIAVSERESFRMTASPQRVEEEEEEVFIMFIQP